MATKKGLNKGLGKGLGALLEDENIQNTDLNAENVFELKITDVEPNKNQPRRFFDEEKLQALADSIAEHGVIQPIVVQKNANGMYTIIAGERRWRASKMAKLKTIPAILKEYSPQTVMEIALIENLQREDLNPIEEAAGYKKLMETFGLTQEQISQRIGKSRPAIANTLRLLNLDKSIQEKISSGYLSPGHARAILSLDNSALALQLADKIITESLNVRQAEEEAKKMLAPKPKAKPDKPLSELQVNIAALQEQVSQSLGTKVKINHSKNKGKIQIEYYSDEQLESLLAFLNSKKQGTGKN